MNDTPLILAWRKIAARQDGPPEITMSRAELQRLLHEMDEQRDRVDDEELPDALVAVASGPDEHCPSSKDDAELHCEHWYECEPCCWCGDDTPDPRCDCPRCSALRGDEQRDSAEGVALDGAAMIAAERRRQIMVEGRTADHDDSHDGGELIDAARCYIVSAEATGFGPDCVTFRGGYRPGEGNPPIWPWNDGWKPSGDAVRDLVKAGALLAAEIDRRTRCAGSEEP